MHPSIIGGTRVAEYGGTGKQRFGAATGIFAPLLAFTCILIAIASYSSFSWTKNALSDLGVVAGITGLVFNFGLVCQRAFSLNFAVFGLFACLGRTWVGKIGASVFAAATIALIAIGVFNESYTGTHYAVSVAFFALMPISMFIITCAFLLTHQARMALFTFSCGVALALPWILLFTFEYVPNVAIPEFVSGLIVSAWAIILGISMLKKQVIREFSLNYLYVKYSPPQIRVVNTLSLYMVARFFVKKSLQEPFYRFNNLIANWKTNEKTVVALVARRV